MERQGGEKRSFYQRGKGVSTSTSKFAGVAELSITLITALVMLFASLAALLLANSLRNQLQETQSQLEETQGTLKDAQSELQETQAARDRQQKTDKAGAAESKSGTVNKSQPQDNTKVSPREGQGQQRAIMLHTQEDTSSSLPYLLLLTLGLIVLASLVLVVTSALTLRFGGSRSGKSEAGPGASTPSRTETSDLKSASLPEEGRWMKLVEECVEVVDELDEHMDNFDAPRREVAGHVVLRLEEILGRSGVEIISDDAIFDRARHKPDADHATTEDGAAVSKTLSPGFAVGPRVLRRARVRLERKEVDRSQTS